MNRNEKLTMPAAAREFTEVRYAVSRIPRATTLKNPVEFAREFGVTRFPLRLDNLPGELVKVFLCPFCDGPHQTFQNVCVHGAALWNCVIASAQVKNVALTVFAFRVGHEAPGLPR